MVGRSGRGMNREMGILARGDTVSSDGGGVIEEMRIYS